MLRTWLTRSLAVLSLGSALMLPGLASANPCYPVPAPVVPARFSHHPEHFGAEVLYRANCNAAWQCYGRYPAPGFAERVAFNLRHQGYEARVVCHR